MGIRKAMTKKGKASTKRVRTVSLNEESVPDVVEEKRVEMSESFEDIITLPEGADGNEAEDLSEIMEVLSTKMKMEDVVEEDVNADEDDDNVETKLKKGEDKAIEPIIVKPKVVYYQQPIQSSQLSSLLSSSTVKIGLIAGGCILGIVIFYMLFSPKKKAGGPTIVEVTDVKIEEKKSNLSEVNNNRISSPRIIFGDLRKNPSLVVAPTVPS
jgi:hypothetical protein